MMGNHDPSAPISLLLRPFLPLSDEKKKPLLTGTVADLQGTSFNPIKYLCTDILQY